jgi:hypothetical protein
LQRVTDFAAPDGDERNKRMVSAVMKFKIGIMIAFTNRPRIRRECTQKLRAPNGFKMALKAIFSNPALANRKIDLSIRNWGFQT